MSQLLLNRLLDAFPRRFLLRLLERQTALYKQSIDLALNDASWGDAEGQTLMPYIRRALWETELRNAAIASNLTTFDSPHFGKNATYVSVKAGQLILTEHYVNRPTEFVRDAESRKQNAGVNKWLTHYTDQRLLTTPLPTLDRKPIYLNLLHGATFPSSLQNSDQVDLSTSFLRFAIPASDSREYLAGCNWSAQELIHQYPAANNKATEPTVKIPDTAVPVIKSKKQA